MEVAKGWKARGRGNTRVWDTMTFRDLGQLNVIAGDVAFVAPRVDHEPPRSIRAVLHAHQLAYGKPSQLTRVFRCPLVECFGLRKAGCCRRRWRRW